MIWTIIIVGLVCAYFGYPVQILPRQKINAFFKKQYVYLKNWIEKILRSR